MLLAAFILLAGLVAVWRWNNVTSRWQALWVMVGLLLMIPPHSDLWEFGIWVAIAYIVDLVGDDAAPGTLLVVSAIFYPLSAVGFNPWWCQLGANLFGIAALGVIGGFGGGILADLRHRRRAGIDALGRVWMGRDSQDMAGGQVISAQIPVGRWNDKR